VYKRQNEWNEEEIQEDMRELECIDTLNHMKQCVKCQAGYRQFLKCGTTKFIGIWTIGMMELPSAVREQVELEFNRLAKETEDWFYSVTVNGKKYFVADNGEFGYTAMLPEEY
jgi:hypothetical protein